MPRWERTRSQHQKHRRVSLAEAKAHPSAVNEGIFSDLSDWIGEDDDLQAHLESFKKMVFTMLNGKKKSVETGDGDDADAVEESELRTKLKAIKEAMVAGKIQPMPALGAPAKKAKSGGWKCQECGKKMSFKTAQKMECPKCGGADIDLDTD